MSTYNNKVLLLIGGTRLINKVTVHHFLELGVRQVRAFSGDEEGMTALRDRLQAAGDLADARVKYYIGDVNAPAYLVEAMAGADFVLYETWNLNPETCEADPAKACATLLAPVNTMIQTALQQNVHKLAVLCPATESLIAGSTRNLLAALLEKVVIAQARLQGQDSPTAICCARAYNELNLGTWDLEPVDFTFTEGRNGDLVIKEGNGCCRIPCENFEMKR